MANVKISDLPVGLELLSDSETFLTDLNKDPASLIYGGGNNPCNPGSKGKSKSKGFKNSKSKNGGCYPQPMPCVPMPCPPPPPMPCY